MNTIEILSAARDMLMLTLLIVSPILLAAILATFVVGVLQASTRMNDLTLSFVPRFVAVLLVIYLSSTWASGRMLAYVERSATLAHLLIE